MTDKELIEIAEQQLKYSYAPYSNFKVRAALLSKDGRVFTGCNIENASYGASNCAERTAVLRLYPRNKRIYSYCNCKRADILTYPCGICRQVLAQFSLI